MAKQAATNRYTQFKKDMQNAGIKWLEIKTIPVVHTVNPDWVQSKTKVPTNQQRTPDGNQFCVTPQ